MLPRVVPTRTAESASGAMNVPASAVSRAEPTVLVHAGMTVLTTGAPAGLRTRM